MTIVQEAISIMERLPRRNQQIVLELLRVMGGQTAFDETTIEKPNEKMKIAALGLAGLWKDHENDLSVEEMVRNMRRGRYFDT